MITSWGIMKFVAKADPINPPTIPKIIGSQIAP